MLLDRHTAIEFNLLNTPSQSTLLEPAHTTACADTPCFTKTLGIITPSPPSLHGAVKKIKPGVCFVLATFTLGNYPFNFACFVSQTD